MYLYVDLKLCNGQTYKIQAVLERLIVLWPTRSQGRSRISIYIYIRASTSRADKHRYRHDVRAVKENYRHDGRADKHSRKQ